MNYRFCLSFLIYALHLSYFLSKKVNLYDDVINVHEFQDQNDFQKHIQSDDDLNPMLVVFYSPWCPHCQHFVEPFSQFADHNQNRDIMFGAVNCERLNDICRSNKYVKGYPTLIAFNLPSTAPDYRRQSSKDGLAVSTAINDLQLFVNANVPLRATKSIPTVYKKVDNKVNQEEGVAEWVRIRAQGAARRAGPDDRLADALTSLDYLLSHELLDNYNEVTHTSVLTLLEVLCSVLPANYNVARAKYSKLREILVRAGHPPLSPQHTSSLQKIIDAIVIKRSSGSSVPLHWEVCGVSGSDGRSEVTKGYTCGLWLLLHFLTIAGDHRAHFEQTLSREVLAGEVGIRVRVPQVMAAVRALVNLFGCNECRRNFLQVLDGCWFDRKRLDTSEATLEDVQFWLFRVHDDVTRRVTFERAAQRLTQANLLDQVTGFMTQTSWPDHQQCNECVTPDATLTSSLEYMHVLDARDPANCRGESNAISLWKREEVLAKLAEVYWDPVQWYWRAILPADAAEVEALLQGYDLTVLDLLPRSRFPTTSFVWIGLGIVIVILFATCCCLAALRLNRGEWISKDRRAAGMRHLSQSDVGFEDEVDEGGLLEVVTSIHKFCNRRKRSRSGDSSIKDLDELKV